MSVDDKEKEYLLVEDCLQQQLHLTTILGSVKFLLFLASTFALFQIAMYTLGRCAAFITATLGL